MFFDKIVLSNLMLDQKIYEDSQTIQKELDHIFEYEFLSYCSIFFFSWLIPFKILSNLT